MYASEQGILNEQLNVAMAAFSNERMKSELLIISHLNPKFGKDGDQFFYIIGNLPEPDCIVGFGETPLKAMGEFCRAYGLYGCSK
jgi:hypothetical protein